MLAYDDIQLHHIGLKLCKTTLVQFAEGKEQAGESYECGPAPLFWSPPSSDGRIYKYIGGPQNRKCI